MYFTTVKYNESELLNSRTKNLLIDNDRNASPGTGNSKFLKFSPSKLTVKAIETSQCGNPEMILFINFLLLSVAYPLILDQRSLLRFGVTSFINVESILKIKS